MDDFREFLSAIEGAWDQKPDEVYRVRAPPEPAPEPDPVLLLGYVPGPLRSRGSVLCAVRVKDSEGNDRPALVRSCDVDFYRTRYYGSVWIGTYLYRAGVPRYHEFRWPIVQATPRTDRLIRMNERLVNDTSRMDGYLALNEAGDLLRVSPGASLDRFRRSIAVPPEGPAWIVYRRWDDDPPRFEDLRGFDETGWDRAGRDRFGYDRAGFDAGGYDRNGYDSEGFDRDGVNPLGVHRASCECSECGRVSEYHSEDRDWDFGAWEDAGRILFGIENELDTANGRARKMVAKLAPKGDWRIITERDGSLGPNGVECIGPPLPLEWYRPKRHEWKGNPWSGFLPAISDQCGARADEPGSTRTYGMHINISRAPIDAHDRKRGDRWGKRIVDTFNDCKALVEYVAGRESTYYARFTGKPDRYLDMRQCSKYRAINVRSSVFEVRIFKSSPDATRLRANVQFCAAVVAWCKRGNRGRSDECGVRLAEWIMAHPRNYPDAVNLIRPWLSSKLTAT